jgi:hypothetical protein
VDENLASTNRLSPTRAVPVVRVGDHFAVKYGDSKDVRLQEGENMLFFQQSSNVPVPIVYAIFHDDKTNKNFIVQEYIPGKMLQGIWGGLSATDKMAVASQLRTHVDGLRSIPSPGYYGGIWRQPNLDFLFADPDLKPRQDKAISGPYETEEQWVEGMLRCAEMRYCYETAKQHFSPVLRRHYRTVFKDHKPVFTHADFFPGNIMIRDDDKSAVIIDWEHAGWYPSFWEYSNACLNLRHADDWGEWLPQVLDGYVAELGWTEYHRNLVM